MSTVKVPLLGLTLAILPLPWPYLAGSCALCDLRLGRQLHSRSLLLPGSLSLKHAALTNLVANAKIHICKHCQVTEEADK